MLDPRTPVLVGIGVTSRRCEDPRDALEPLALMVEASERAATDAGRTDLASRADSIRVPRGFWEYSDPGRLVARAVGAEGARTVLAEIGVLQQTLINDACRDIAQGREQISIVLGGEARHRSMRAQKTGWTATLTEQTDEMPDSRLEPAGSLWSELEADQGLMMPVQFYGAMENALRFDDRQDLAAHRDLLAELYAGFSRIAADNPHAWGPAPVSAEEIASFGGSNRMISFPYAKYHNSSWNVDQAAALIFCSLELARDLGLDEERFIYPLAGTESNHMLPVSARPEIHRNVGVDVAGQRALELAGVQLEELSLIELYSCFPSAVRIFARSLGLEEKDSGGRPLTVTGGMAFAGGPLNNYVLQSTARMAECLREGGQGTGLVTSVSGFMNKSGFCIWSTSPPAVRFEHADVTEEVAAKSKAKEIAPSHEGLAQVVAYTVAYLGDTPHRGIVICDLADGRRAVASSEEAALAAAMTEVEVCGRTASLGSGGRLLGIEGLT